jgi:hypothetical protein
MFCAVGRWFQHEGRCVLNGSVEKAASGVLAPWPCSRPPPYALLIQQWLPPLGCTRQFAALGLAGWAFLNTTHFFVWLSGSPMWINREDIEFIQQSLNRWGVQSVLEVSIPMGR